MRFVYPLFIYSLAKEDFWFYCCIFIGIRTHSERRLVSRTELCSDPCQSFTNLL